MFAAHCLQFAALLKPSPHFRIPLPRKQLSKAHQSRESGKRIVNDSSLRGLACESTQIKGQENEREEPSEIPGDADRGHDAHRIRRRSRDSDGNVYDLDKLKKKAFLGDKYQKEITVPGYVKNVSKVIIWCAWAEANLGEASFSSPVK